MSWAFGGVFFGGFVLDGLGGLSGFRLRSADPAPACRLSILDGYSAPVLGAEETIRVRVFLVLFCFFGVWWGV
jgi:hypothetical protein